MNRKQLFGGWSVQHNSDGSIGLFGPLLPYELDGRTSHALYPNDKGDLASIVRRMLTHALYANTAVSTPVAPSTPHVPGPWTMRGPGSDLIELMQKLRAAEFNSGLRGMPEDTAAAVALANELQTEILKLANEKALATASFHTLCQRIDDLSSDAKGISL